MQSDNPTPSQDFISEVESEQRDEDCRIPTELSAKKLSDDEALAKELERLEKKTDIKLKRIYGIVILCILGLWEIFVIVFSCVQLNPNCCAIRHMTDTVIIALWTSATANIVALPTIILRYLFPKRH